MHRKKLSHLILWHSNPSESWQATSVPEAMELRAAGRASVANETPDLSDIMIQPLHPVPEFIGALLVPETWSSRVSLNGVPLPSGMQLLRHADRVDVDQQSFWVSTQAIVEETGYDPAVHGQEVFCFLTKSRLAAGQPIKICPGVPGTACGVIYKAAAWEMAMQSATPMKCPHCGYRPGEGEWRPPETKTRTSIDGILELIRR